MTRHMDHMHGRHRHQCDPPMLGHCCCPIPAQSWHVIPMADHQEPQTDDHCIAWNLTYSCNAPPMRSRCAAMRRQGSMYASVGFRRAVSSSSIVTAPPASSAVCQVHSSPRQCTIGTPTFLGIWLTAREEALHSMRSTC